jgi:hypothetical protein
MGSADSPEAKERLSIAKDNYGRECYDTEQ